MAATTYSYATYPDLAGKVAVVTGGSRGIGAAAAAALAVNGALVAVVGRDQATLDASAKALIDAGGHAVGMAADCTCEQDMAALAGRVNDELGQADIVVAFAGGNGMPVPSADETAEHWRQVLDGDLTATYLTISAFLADLVERNGSVVTMASSSARQATRSSAAYAAAKAGVIGLTRHLAGELGPQGVRVNCVAPATVENDRMRHHMSDDSRRQLAAGFPLGRIGQPTDVAAATCFLASQASSWITGITLDVAGGRVMP
jgi:3-oxoacyl-[acyl-carrier protein] reductase